MQTGNDYCIAVIFHGSILKYSDKKHGVEMKKIDDFIEKYKIKPSECIYHTMRDTPNKQNKLTGKIRVLVPKSDGRARVEYKCPECGHEAYTEAEWKRPFSVICEKCGFRIKVPKLKGKKD